jgi:TrmH family RNA methyltransferase
VAVLTSAHNPLVKSIRRAVQRGSLTDDGLCVAEGFHLLEEALRSDREVPAVLTTEAARAVVTSHIRGLSQTRLHIVSDALFREVSTTENAQGVVSLVQPPTWTVEHVLRGQSLAVVLDSVQEPGNAGAILRAAEAFGATGAVFLKGSVNPFNPKCLRASAGSLFRLPMIYAVDDGVFWAAAEQRRLTIYAAMPRAEMSLGEADLTARCAFIIGGEGSGVRPDIVRRAQELRIPTVAVESLNAAVAAGILLYEARRQRMLRS